MQGGIRAWEGMTAAGSPEAGTAFFTPAANAKELIALAWILEEGSRRFYEEAQHSLPDSDMRNLLPGFVSAEQHHKRALEDLYQSLTGSTPGPGFPFSLLPGATSNDHMEGGVRVSEALAWIEGKSVHEFLELSMSLETASYDLYIRMERKTEDGSAKKVFRALLGEEKEHLERLASVLDRKL